MNTLEVISKILNLNLDIEELKFVELKSSEIVQDNKIINDSAQNQINSALEIRNKHNFPFWDCICSTFINNKSYSKNLLRQVLHHNYNKDVISIHRSLFSEVDQHLSSHKNYAILSRVILAVQVTLQFIFLMIQIQQHILAVAQQTLSL